jgi:ferredoxin-NADP reductase
MVFADALKLHLDCDLPIWTGKDDNRLVCQRIVRETHDVSSFIFAAPTPHRFRFLPGQFLTFELPVGGSTVHRSYTIASPPTRPHTVSITSKRVTGGAVSNWLHDHLRVGMALAANGPAGDFSTFHHPAPKYLFLSAGSGITPLMSMARSYHDLGAETDIVFVHSARSPADIIFREELERLSHVLPGFKLALICERDSPMLGWAGYRGRLSLPMLHQIAPDFTDREIFTCGPAPYMNSVRTLLAEGGADARRYHQESFNFEQLQSPLPQVPAQPSSGYTIEFTKSGRTILCGPYTTILQAATAAGLKLSFACTQGICGTCKSRMLSGRVDMRHEGGIRQREIDQGLILPCCARPLDNIVLER